ncbi:MAG: hypothetical protein ABFQ64_03190 [Campylobacterota bacterium]
MATDKKWNILFIKDDMSMFDLTTSMLELLFERVDISSSREESLEFFNTNQYDIVIGDLSVAPEGVAFLKQIKDIKPEQAIFALVSPKDTDKLYSIADLGINAFELTPAQFEQALESIAQFNPYE